jgi:ATP-dependent 26S proteasome regulatory subunit
LLKSGQHKKAILPLNMSELIKAQQDTLLKNVDEETKSLYQEKQTALHMNSLDAEGVDFTKVAGLDEHIRELKEMVTIPLLYPELFSNFKITPPRGIFQVDNYRCLISWTPWNWQNINGTSIGCKLFYHG